MRLSATFLTGLLFLLLLHAADASAAIVIVTTTADDLTPNDGSVSLREAITAINAGNNLGDSDIAVQIPGTFGIGDTINFSMAGAGVKTINVGTHASAAGLALPTCVKPMVIDGYTQGVAAVNTLANADNALLLVELNGTSAGSTANGLTLGAGSAGSTIRGLAINRFKGNGMVVQSSGNTIAGNFVGVDPAGEIRMPNGTFPVSGDGILIQNASNNLIGTTAVANRNVVSGNAVDGIHIVGSLTAPATGNLVRNNFVGVAADGKSSVGNRTEPAPLPGAAEGNNLFGIEISGGNNNTIGGTTAGARNVVGLNWGGIEVNNGAQGNLIQGNFAGVGADGVAPDGNLRHGIALRSSNGFGAPLGPAQLNEPGTSFNLIGGTVPGAGNLVEFNSTGGIAVFGNPVSASGQPNVGNTIEGNSIFENGRSNSPPAVLLGIDLTNLLYPADDGATANDSQGHGAPNNPNNLQNFPVLTSVSSNGGSTTITAALKSTPNSVFRVEFYASNIDPLGLPAEGQTFYGSANATTDANGDAVVNGVVSLVPNGSIVTATATDAVGNTSEFSLGLVVPSQIALGPPATVVATAVTPASIDVSWSPVGGASSYDVARSADGTNYTIIASTNGTLVIDYQVAPNTAYVYKVRSNASSASVTSAYGAPDLATTVIFTNATLAGAPIKAVDVSELRVAVNAVRALAGYPALVLTDTSIVPGQTEPQAAHVTELRGGLDPARATLGLTPQPYAEPTITADSTTIKAQHILELRNGVQ